MSLICNSDRVIPVSMSIWCYTPNGKDVRIALMPIRVSDVDLFAPVTYETLSAGEWRRFTRTIYIPANTAMSLNATNIYLGGALAVSDNGAKVYFALPMVTFGSTPSTWFPSAYDIFNEINSVSSSASSALSTAKAAQSTANSASSIASTANSTANSALTTANTAQETANTAVSMATTAYNTANNKVSKSGDTMTGDLNMNGNNIDLNSGNLTEVDAIYVDRINSFNNNFVTVNAALSLENCGFYDSDDGSKCTYSQLMQGDGYPRNIITTISNSTSIPTGSAVYSAIRNGNLIMYSVGSATATAYAWAPNTYTTTYGSSNFQYLFSHTATSLTVTIGTSTYFNNNIQYLLIQQTTNTCNITLSGTNVKTKGNITSFTVAAGQSIEFSCLYVNGYNYVTYTIFG